jgi:hypothetical protein
MNKDKLQVWALAAEIIGGIAVVVSLGVVAFELNQSNAQAKLNTNALEISAYQSLINSIHRSEFLNCVRPRARNYPW